MIDGILRGTQIRTPTRTGTHPADELQQLRDRIERAEQRRTALARTPQGWLGPDSPELAGLGVRPPEETRTLRRQQWRRVCDDVRSLCHFVLAVPGASTRTARFVLSDQPVDPVGARGLGCLLYLVTAGEGDGARFWWRYAAGIGDATAAYLAFLEALLRGEQEEAVHCYRALHGDAFLCDDDFDPEPYTERDAGRAPIHLEGYLQDISIADKQLAALV